jgi:hypothetical protein
MRRLKKPDAITFISVFERRNSERFVIFGLQLYTPSKMPVGKVVSKWAMVHWTFTAAFSSFPSTHSLLRPVMQLIFEDQRAQLDRLNEELRSKVFE